MPHRVKGTPWPQQPEKALPKPPRVTKAKQKHIDKEQDRIDNLIKSMPIMNRRQRRKIARKEHIAKSLVPKYSYAESKELEKNMLVNVPQQVMVEEPEKDKEL
jgi:hypothetical protein